MDKFTHGGAEGGHFGFTARQQSLIQGFNVRVIADGDDSAHVQHGAYESTGGPARVFRDFGYQTLESWSTERRVVGKAEYLLKGENPRFIVAAGAAVSDTVSGQNFSTNP